MHVVSLAARGITVPCELGVKPFASQMPFNPWHFALWPPLRQLDQHVFLPLRVLGGTRRVGMPGQTRGSMQEVAGVTAKGMRRGGTPHVVDIADGGFALDLKLCVEFWSCARRSHCRRC